MALCLNSLCRAFSIQARYPVSSFFCTCFCSSKTNLRQVARGFVMRCKFVPGTPTSTRFPSTRVEGVSAKQFQCYSWLASVSKTILCQAARGSVPLARE
jgi:hypothetical protein